nr:hypothetical protein [Tanacetum cinerariifolium]
MAQTTARNHAQRGNHKKYARMSFPNPQRHVVPTTVLPQSRLVLITAARPVTTDVPKFTVTRPRQVKTFVTKPTSPPRRHINRSPSPKASNFTPKVTIVKAPMGNPQHALKDKGVIDIGCSKHMTGNMSYLSEFKELNHGYVAFGGNPNGGKISDTKCIVLSPKFKLLDENQVLLRVPRENNMYNVNLKNIIPFGDLTCLFAKATLDESNLWHRRLGHINFKTMNKLVKGSGPTWLFDIITLTKTMNYQPVTAGNQSNPSAGVQEQFATEKNTDGDAAFDEKEPEFEGRKPESKVNVSLSKFEDFYDNSNNEVNAIDSPVPAVRQISTNSTNTFSATEDITYSDDEDDVGAEADFNNLETSIIVSLIPTTRVHKDHPVTQIIGDLSSATQTRSMTRVAKDQGGLSQINNDDFHTCMFSCFLSQEEPKRVHQALKDPSWIEAMQVELLQFKMQKVWVLVDLPHGKQAIGTKWVFRNKNDEKGIVVREKARLVAQGHTQEKGIDYEEVFAPVAWIEAIRFFLAYASFMGFVVYQMDVKSAFLYETIEEELYVCQPPGFEDPDYPDKVYKVVNALYGLHQAPRAWYKTLANYLLENGFQRGKIDQTLFIKQKKDKYVAKILKKFGLTDGKSASTPIDTKKPLLKDPDDEDVDVHTYRSMIGSLMIFRYLKGKPRLGLWYPKDSPFNLVAYSDSDYAGASLDMKSTIGGCQFLGCRLISWQCKKQPVVATSSTKAKYIAAVALSNMKSLKRMLHLINILSAGSLTTPQMVLNSPCLTHIKNWLVQIKWSMSWLVQKQKAIGVNTPRCDEDRLDLLELMVFLPSDEKVGIEVCAVDL